MSIKGLSFIGKMGDYINQVLHVTVQKVGNSKSALDVTTRAYYCVNGISTPLVIEAGSTDNQLVCTGLDALPGDVIRIVSSSNGILEKEITVDEIIDADTVLLAGFLSANLAIGDTFHLLRPTLNLVSSDGASLATVISPPVQYNVKAAGVTSATTVLDDQDTPANTKPLPVVIRGTDGATITINAGDMNVSIDHTNDSTKIGDGVTLAGVTLSNELKVHDETLANIDFATDAKLDDAITQLTALAKLADVQPVLEQDNTSSGTINILNSNRTGVATAGSSVEIDTAGKAHVAFSVVGTWTGALGIEFTIDGTTWVAGAGTHIMNVPNGSYGATVTSGQQGIYRVGVSGVKKFRVSASSAMTGSVAISMIASKGSAHFYAPLMESTLGGMSAKLPSSLGQKAMAASMSVAIASDQGAVPVSGPLTDTQLRASAVPVSLTSTPLPTNAATDTVATANGVLIGAVNETAPATDTGSSGLNGRLQRLAQRITSLIALFPTSLGQKTMANSFAVNIASDQSTLTMKKSALTASYAEIVNLTTSAQTFTAPANAIGGKIYTDDTNTVNVRWKQGATATVSSGLQLQPARGEEVGNGSDISVIAESGASQKVYVIWNIQA